MALAIIHPFRFPIFVVLLLLSVVLTSSSSKDSDARNLIKFRDALVNNGALSGWDVSKPVCTGDESSWGDTILCDKGTLWGLKLENLHLKGTINVDALKEIKTLRSLSLMKNEFDGPFPQMNKIGNLRSLYLSYNNFQGVIPSEAFDGMNLKKLYLKNNSFTGRIPTSLTTLPRLLELSIANNHFSGRIPDFSPGTVRIFNASNNDLEGQIPLVLSYFSSASFSGNKHLCGTPLDPCTTSLATKLSIATVALLSVVCLAVIAGLILLVILVLHRRRTDHINGVPPMILPEHRRFQSLDLNRLERGPTSPDNSTSGKKSVDNENVKLSFLRDDRTEFDMTDLLKASAETLGNGKYGSTYKAAIVGGPTMVVKRYRYMNNVEKVDFCDHMRRLGRLNHTNLLPFVAFYYRRDEKLLVFDHVDNGSLEVYLHGNESRQRTSLYWQTRLKIIKGIARGLMYLHNELPDLVTPHGHLKSSNVLLSKETMEPILTDYALIPLINQEQAQQNLTAYKSPEFQQTGQISKKTDVWGLGMLILEILTGKTPTTSWVESIVGEELNPDIIDEDMPGKRGHESEMIKVLKIGLKCCEADVEKRWDMNEAVEMIEGVRRESMVDDDFYSVTSAATDDKHSSRGLSDEFKF